jgi:hypothetical protein
MACPTCISNSCWSLQIISNGDPGGMPPLEETSEFEATALREVLRIIEDITECCCIKRALVEGDEKASTVGEPKKEAHDAAATNRTDATAALLRLRMNGNKTCCCCELLIVELMVMEVVIVLARMLLQATAPVVGVLWSAEECGAQRNNK